MKKFIALFLCICLSLGLCACGAQDGTESSTPASNNSATGGFAIDYKNVVPGFISHTSELNSTIFKSDTFECTDDFYVYLPKGTTLSSEKEFAVYCYNQHFALDLDLTKNCGQTLLRFSVQVNSATKTLTEDCYVRLSVGGKIEDVVITVPDGSEGTVITGAKDDLLYGPQINLVEQSLRDKNETVNYIFITDLHYDSDPTAQKSEALLKQVKAAVKMANTIDNIDFIVIGGDSTSGMYETKADALKYTAEIFEPLKASTKPVFIVPGNHDDNSYLSFHMDGFLEEEIVSDKDWSDNVIKVFCPEDVVKDTKHKDSKYYYYDLADKKTRVICLDAIDYRAQYDANGVIKELPIKDKSATDEEEKYWAGTNYWGYSDGQMKWLVDEAMTADADWNYVFFSHVGIDWNTMSNSYETKSGNMLRSIMSAYQGRSTINAGNVSADFSNVKGKILSYQFGHTHTELTVYSKDLNLWQICTATAQVSNNAEVIGEPKVKEDSKGNDWVSYDRQYGSDNEACFDVMAVSDKKVYKYAFGAGTNEELSYDK